MDLGLEGKVAIVTGGASGLGQATVEAYVARGVKVAIFDLNEERANQLIEKLGADKVAFWKVNVADEDSVKSAVAEVVEKFGALHICNNFAGIASACKTLGKNGVFPLDQYMPVININLVGTFNVSRFAAEQMARNEQVRCIRRALGRLSDDDRNIMLMRIFEQLTFDDIGYVLDIEAATARKRYGRALIRLGKITRDMGMTESQI